MTLYLHPEIGMGKGHRAYLIQNRPERRFNLRPAWIKDDPFREAQNKMIGLAPNENDKRVTLQFLKKDPHFCRGFKLI
jgi:hypothetical protein